MKSMNRINQSSTEIQENSKIIDRFNKIIHNEPIKEEIIIEENTPFYKDKNTYIIIGGVIILLGLGYYYFDDIKPIGTAVLAWINSFRPRPDGNGGNPGVDLQGHSNMNLRSLKDNLSRRIWGDRDDGFIDRQSADTSPDRRPIQLDKFKPSHELVPDLSGISESSDYAYKTNAINLLQNLNNFLNARENNHIPDNTLQAGLYKKFKDDLHEFSQSDLMRYNALLVRDPIFSDTIHRFRDLEDLIINSAPVPEYESDTYNEIALATIQEQDVWSDRGNSPSVHSQLLSPITNLVNEAAELSDNDLLNKVGESFKEESEGSTPIKLGVSNADRDELLNTWNLEENPVPIEYYNPEINIDHNSDKSSLDHYFPETQIPIIEDIRAKRIEKFEAISPSVSNIGLQTPIENRLNVSPLLKKPSISNLFDDTMGLFDDDENMIGIDTSGESNKDQFIQGSSNEVVKENSPPSLMKQIRSHRLEYGTPPDKHEQILQDSSNKEIKDDNEIKTKSSFMNLFEQIRAVKPQKPIISTNTVDEVTNTTNNPLEEVTNNENSPIINSIELDPWADIIKPQIFNHNKFDRNVQIDFNEKFDETKYLMIITNDGHSIFIDPHKKSTNTIQAFNWDERGLHNPEYIFNDLEVVSISLFDKENKNHCIYRNLAPNYLNCWDENISKPSNRDLFN
jgi:hypothetical protein